HRRDLRERGRPAPVAPDRAARAADARRHGRLGRVHRLLHPPAHHVDGILRPQVTGRTAMRERLADNGPGPASQSWAPLAILDRLRTRRTQQHGAHALRGMTLLEIMIVLAILALVMGFLVGPAIFKSFQESKGEVAKNIVRKLANEAYPQWAMKPSNN